MPWIFSYSDLGPQIIQKILKSAPFCALPATLPNYKVVFKGKSRKWGGALASVEKSRKDFVYGSALLLPPDDIKHIDKYYQTFEKVELPIFIDATQDKVKAYVYILKVSASYGTPSQEYITVLVKHLKFFWGGGRKSITLDDFGISTEIPAKKENIKKPDDDSAVVIQETSKKTRSKKKSKNTRKRKISKA